MGPARRRATARDSLAAHYRAVRDGNPLTVYGFLLDNGIARFVALIG